jgi:uroporphyrinogen-III decarboxylase
MWQGTAADMVETGGGAGSNTVISPKMFREFCLPYDKIEHEALHAVGVKVVYHLCGGLMHVLDMVVENGADGLETMTPPSMGGDCDLQAASERVGDRLFFIGGFDQNAGFERGTPEAARRLVHACFSATQDHAGYIISPSDHFFLGDPANLKAFASAAQECVY